MKVIFSVFLLGFVLLMLLMDQKGIRAMIEFISVYWFRFAFSILVLFLLNVAAGFFGVYVPINLVSGLVITVLGIPGIVSVLIIALIL